jgi:hypothetical protein
MSPAMTGEGGPTAMVFASDLRRVQALHPGRVVADDVGADRPELVAAAGWS